MKHKLNALYISLGIALVFVILGIVSPSATQCPDDYTQEQIDSADCNVGAYIGIPPVYDFIIAGSVLAVGSLITLVKLSRKN
jgi:hypothetical protein